MNVLIVSGTTSKQVVCNDIQAYKARYIIFLDQSCYVDSNSPCQSISLLNILQYYGPNISNKMPDFYFSIDSDSTDSALIELVSLYKQNCNLVAELVINYIRHLRKQHNFSINIYLIPYGGTNGAIGPSGIDANIVIEKIIDLNNSSDDIYTIIKLVFRRQILLTWFASCFKSIFNRISLKILNIYGIIRLTLILARKEYKNCLIYLGDGIPSLNSESYCLNLILSNSIRPVVEKRRSNTICLYYHYNSINSLLQASRISGEALANLFSSATNWLMLLNKRLDHLSVYCYLSDHVNVSNLYLESLLRKTGTNYGYVEHGSSRSDIHRISSHIVQNVDCNLDSSTESYDSIIKGKDHVVFVTYGIYKSTGFKSNPINYVETIRKILSNCGTKVVSFARKPISEPKGTISDIVEYNDYLHVTAVRPLKFVSIDRVLVECERATTIIIAVHHLGNAHSQLIENGFTVLYAGKFPNQIEWSYTRLVSRNPEKDNDNFFVSTQLLSSLR